MTSMVKKGCISVAIAMLSSLEFSLEGLWCPSQVLLWGSFTMLPYHHQRMCSLGIPSKTRALQWGTLRSLRRAHNQFLCTRIHITGSNFPEYGLFPKILPILPWFILLFQFAMWLYIDANTWTTWLLDHKLPSLSSVLYSCCTRPGYVCRVGYLLCHKVHMFTMEEGAAFPSCICLCRRKEEVLCCLLGLN